VQPPRKRSRAGERDFTAWARGVWVTETSSHMRIRGASVLPAQG
jgi:hypothetical protein